MVSSARDLINQKKQQVADKRAGSKNTYRFKNAKTTIRILPGWRKDDPTFFHDFGQSWIKDMDGNVLAVIGDAKLTYGKDDPIRGLIGKAIGEARTDAQREHYKEMLAKARVLVNAQVLDDKDVDPEIPEIVDFSETQFVDIMEIAENTGILDEFLDLNEGFDLVVGKTGKGFNTKYTFTFARKPRAVPESVMENINDLDAFIRAKFTDHDRAVNALKSLTQSENLQITDRSTSYSGNAEPMEADYDPVEDAKLVDNVEAQFESRTVTEEDLDKLFD